MLRKLLASRKFVVAVVTIIAMVGAELGLDVSEDLVEKIFTIGLSLIGGIALEDAAAKRAGGGLSL